MSSRWKERKAKTKRETEDVKKKKIHARARKMFLAWDRQLCQWQWTRRGWRQPQEVQQERKESKRTSEIPQGTWHGGAQRGSLWLRYAGSLAEKRKSEISGNQHKMKTIPWERNSWGDRRGGRRGR